MTSLRHGLLLKGVALFVYQDEEFDFAAMCCLRSMLMYQPHASSLHGVEMSIVMVYRVTGNVIAGYSRLVPRLKYYTKIMKIQLKIQ